MFVPFACILMVSGGKDNQILACCHVIRLMYWIPGYKETRLGWLLLSLWYLSTVSGIDFTCGYISYSMTINMPFIEFISLLETLWMFWKYIIFVIFLFHFLDVILPVLAMTIVPGIESSYITLFHPSSSCRKYSLYAKLIISSQICCIEYLTKF